MEIDQYAFCPCGSGKKFKWCCQGLYAEIERAYTQLEQGQKDTALKIMGDLTRAHATNPEAWGQQAQILLALGKREEGEASLQKALDINPGYPFGLLLQARLRAEEGELGGALILARRAAEAYHPEALDYLAQVFGLIFQIEMQRQRPLAAHAALRILVRCQPGDQELRDLYEGHFGKSSPLPVSACQVLDLQHPSGSLVTERRQAWDDVLKVIETPRLQSLVAAFDRLTQEDASDKAAWFNLGVAQSWLGENRKALDAFDRYLDLESDEEKLTLAGTLQEILRCGQGLENDADYKQYATDYQLRDPQPVIAVLQGWGNAGRLIVQQNEEQRSIAAMVLEVEAPAVLTGTGGGPQNKRLSGYLVLAGGMLRIWGPHEDAYQRMRQEIQEKAGEAVVERGSHVGPATFGDVVSAALLFPDPVANQAPNEQDVKRQILDNAARYFEEEWIHQPLRSLAGNTPLDGVGHPLYRKKLLGIIRFLGECAAKGALAEYDFGRLRHKLGLGAAPATPTAGETDGRRNIAAMNAADLSNLQAGDLSEEDLEQAYQAAAKLDARELAANFVKTLIERPVADSARPRDRFSYFAFLIQQDLGDGKLDEAVDHVNEGEKQDCEFNDGRRRNDYELRRAQIHVKRKEPDQAFDVFARLIERAPEQLKFRTSAVEGMLSLRQGKKAQQFAEEALTAARKQKDRDSEQHLLELLEAAKKQG